MAEEPGTLRSVLQLFFDKGVRFSTVLDLGCADGHFYLAHFNMGLLPGAMPVNVDANAMYEPSLRAIQDVLGGHYVIAAVTDRMGEVELTTSAHPYWNSLRPANDPYWERVNWMSEGKMKVPAVTVDSLVQKFDLKPPFLLKLDIQGAEADALKGARETLKNTNAVIVEADIADFSIIHGVLEESGLKLFDIVETRRLSDKTLGWFYPVYIGKRIDAIRPRAFWNRQVNDIVIQQQAERRKGILQQNTAMLETLRRIRDSR